MSSATSGSPSLNAPRLTSVQWLICAIAAIGFAFDIYELLMLPLILRPAMVEFGIPPSDFPKWISIMFFVPAFVGGIFGLLGGYLTDRLGRRRVLTWSILLYAFSAFAAGYSTNIYMLLFFRCTTFIGVCVEFVAAVAWLAELFPEHKQRERVLGYTQAFSSVGGLLVAVMNGLAVSYHMHLPHIDLPDFLNVFGGEIHNDQAPWRYTLMSGLLPAIPLIVIRPFLPESPAWQKKKEAGTLKRPSIAAIFAPDLRKTTIVTTLMFACSYGAAFGAIQMIQQIVPGLPEVLADVNEQTDTPEVKAKIAARLASDEVQQQIAKAPEKAEEIRRAEIIKIKRASGGSIIVQKHAANVTKVQEVGGLIGRFALALLTLRILSRRSLIRAFQVPGMILMPLVFGLAAVSSLNWTYLGMFAVSILTVGQFSFWGNYLPRVYPVHLRGTGESFAANIGGRMIGTSFAAVTSGLATLMPGDSMPTKIAYAAAGVGLFVYAAGFILSFWLPEPPEKMEE